MTGDTMFMNQFGRNGVIRRNTMQLNRCSRCRSTYNHTTQSTVSHRDLYSKYSQRKHCCTSTSTYAICLFVKSAYTQNFYQKSNSGKAASLNKLNQKAGKHLGSKTQSTIRTNQPETLNDPHHKNKSSAGDSDPQMSDQQDHDKDHDPTMYFFVGIISIM